MEIRNIHTNPFNDVESDLNPVSMTIPDDAMTVSELYSRYVEGTLDRERAMLERKLQFDGYDVDIDDSLEPEDMTDLWEIDQMTKEAEASEPTPEPIPTPTPTPESGIDSHEPPTEGS